MLFKYFLAIIVPEMIEVILKYEVPSKSSETLPLKSTRVEWYLCADGNMNHHSLGSTGAWFRPAATFRRSAGSHVLLDVFNTFCDEPKLCSVVSKRRPFSLNFNFRKRKRSTRTRFVEER